MDLAESLGTVSAGFELLFANDLVGAIDVFGADEHESPFHLMAHGMCLLLEGVLGSMEPELMEEVIRLLQLSQAGAKKCMKLARSGNLSHRFALGIEWEVLQADVSLLLGLAHASSETYKGYLQCLYELNSAHSKFARLFKTVYPNGLLDEYATPGQTRSPSREGSIHDIRVQCSHPVRQTGYSGLLAYWGFTFSRPSSPVPGSRNDPSSSMVEDMILSGAAFGHGLFNLVLSLLPSNLRTLVGFLGFNNDQQVALQVLAVSASRSDMHSVFAGLVLMTYYAVILHMTGYLADEEHIVRQYKGIVNKVLARYPRGTYWILNKAKIQRVTRDAKSAIQTLKDGLSPDRPQTFPQADTLLAFELAWTLLGFRRYEECAEIFLGLMKTIQWSHATHLFMAAGCYVSSGRLDEAQHLLDKLPECINNRKKMLPMDVFLKKKLEFYKRKQIRRGGDPNRYVEAIKISPAEEYSIFWKNHTLVDEAAALAHIKEFSAFTPPIGTVIKSVPTANTKLDLDTPDELAVRSLILGVLHRTIGDYATGRTLLNDVLKHGEYVEISTWTSAVAYVELAILEMKDGERKSSEQGGRSGKTYCRERKGTSGWGGTFKAAKEMLARATSLCTYEMDFSSTLGSQIMMLKEEIKKKMEMVGHVDT